MSQSVPELGAAAVDPRSDGAELEPEHVGDLLVGQTFDVAEHHRGTELRSQRIERSLHVGVEDAFERDLLGSRDPAEDGGRRRAWSRKRFVVIRCSHPSKVPGV
jgi:hypothetical protein